MWQAKHMDILEEGFRQTDGFCDYWDLHVGCWGAGSGKKVREACAAFRDMVRRLNPQSKMRLAIFEENGNHHDMRRALAHASILIACREQGDFLLTSCPANALQPYNHNDNGWDQGQVFFTPDKAWLQPCAWAQAMASAAHRDVLVANVVEGQAVEVSATRDDAGRSVVLHRLPVRQLPDRPQSAGRPGAHPAARRDGNIPQNAADAAGVLPGSHLCASLTRPPCRARHCKPMKFSVLVFSLAPLAAMAPGVLPLAGRIQ